MEWLSQGEPLLDRLGLPPELRSAPEVKLAAAIAADFQAQVNDWHGNGHDIIRSAQTGNYAGYHHGGHTAEVIDGSVEHALMSGVDDPLVIACCIMVPAAHDIHQGEAEPGQNERLSADRLCAAMQAHGFDEATVERAFYGVLGTQLVPNAAPGRIRQVAYATTDIVSEAVALADLGSITKRRGPVRSLNLFIEFHPDILIEYFTPLTQLEIMQIIEADVEATQRFIDYVSKQAGFFAAVDLPQNAAAVYEAEYTHRQDNIRFMTQLAEQLQSGRLSVSQAYQAALDYADQ